MLFVTSSVCEGVFKKKGWFSKMKTKRIISLLASMAMMVTAVTGAMSVSAVEDNGKIGDNLTWTLDANGKLTISGKGEMASPDVNHDNSGDEFTDFYTYKKYKDDIKEVMIEEGVTSIGYRAFCYFKNLETVSIPSTITKFTGFTANIGYRNNAFEGCTSLTNLNLAEGMTCIGHRAFENCTSLETVVIPSTITEWGNYSFSNCTSLKNITLSEGLIILGGGAFRGTAVESIYIPSTIENWERTNDYAGSGVGAFQECTNLKSITFGDGLKMLGGNMANLFYGCTSLEEVAFGDDSQITNIAFGCFTNCTSLKVVEIPDKVESMGDAFALCGSVKTVYLYSRTLDSYNLPKNATIFAYSDAVANSQTSCMDIENAINNALNDLKTAVKEAEKYSEEDYTTASYGVLKALLNEAATKDDESHVLGMNHLTEDIYSAIEGLRDKSEEPSSSEPSSSDPSDSSNPSDNSSDPSNSSDNNNQSQSPNTPGTPSTSAPTTATPKPTTPPIVTTTAKPAKVKAVKLKANKRKLNVSWKKVSGATGYEVLSATNNKFTKNKKTVTVKKNKVTLKKLKPKKKYFVKVRAYKLASGRKYFGKWSKVVKKKTK